MYGGKVYPYRSVSEYPHNIKGLTGDVLKGWCIYFRVQLVYGNGNWVPEPHLRMNLSTAVQHHQIYGRLWDNVGGWGPHEQHEEYSLSAEFGGDWDYAEHTRDWVDNS